MPIVTDGLVGYWHAQARVNGTIWKNLVQGQTGKDATIAGTGTHAVDAKGMIFNGTSDTASTPALGGTYSGYTIEVGLTPNQQSGAGSNYVIANNVGAVTQIGIKVVTSTNTLGVYYSNNHYDSTAALTSGSTYVVQLVIPPSAVPKLYLDGTDTGLALAGVPQNNTPTGNLVIGSLDGTVAFYSGSIQFVRIYNRPLTVAEKDQNYSAGSTLGIDMTPPAEVTNLTASYNINSMSLGWTNPADADFTKVRIYRDGNYLTETTGTSYTDSTVQEWTLYNYRITTVDTNGNESAGAMLAMATKGVEDMLLYASMNAIAKNTETNVLTFDTATAFNLRGFIATGNAPGRYVLRVGGATPTEGAIQTTYRTSSVDRTAYVVFPDVAYPSGAKVYINVVNEEGDGAHDYESTLIYT